MSSRIIFLALAAAMGVFSLIATAEICRSVSASWKADSGVNRTVVWTRAINGCKEIEHQKAASYDALATMLLAQEDHVNSSSHILGTDCNCDLIADGYEGQISAPPSANNSKLLGVCNGPIADHTG